MKQIYFKAFAPILCVLACMVGCSLKEQLYLNKLKSLGNIKSRYEPPFALKNIHIKEISQIQIKDQISSQDRQGLKRIQLYLDTDTKITQAHYWELIELYKKQYDIIWFYRSKQTGETDLSRWQNTAAWFANKIPKQYHFFDFKAKNQFENLYWGHD